jgi:hypothetical protein
MGNGFWVMGFGFWVLGNGFWVLGNGFWGDESSLLIFYGVMELLKLAF